ncbi:MAG: tripartite tricarboxylate transporter substrate binding protein [Planctomycetes bacterium]|nr:tripartite tricarboxylate transporter substrate binding protein [Planctomycetota bacterium]
MRRAAALLASIALLVGAPACGPESRFPSRSILLVCPWAVGGGTDRISRQLAAYLEADLDVPVNVLNATGGAGVTGHSRGARARPDGYTLTMMTVEINMLHWRRLTSISWRDFEPLLLLNRDAAALFVRSDAPWRDIAELTDEVRSRPGALTASGTATGGIWHLALAGWLTSVGLGAEAIRWVPSGGAGPSLQELNSGGVDVVCCSLPEARTLLLAGRIRALAVMSDDPAPGAEDVPTFRSQGVDWSMGGWRGIGVPPGTPSGRAAILRRALERVARGEVLVSGQAFPDLLRREWYDTSWEPPDAFRRRLERTDETLGRLLRSEAFASLRRSPVRPYAFPLILLGLLAVSLALLAVSRGRASPEARAALASLSAATRSGWIHFAEVLAAVALYALLAESIGFVLTAGAILLVLLVRLGNRWRTSLAVSVLMVPLVYELFAHILRVELPRGVLGW